MYAYAQVFYEKAIEEFPNSAVAVKLYEEYKERG